jgi:DNA topoisomerase IB
MPDAPGINPAFEALHPRDKTGRDAGEFVDVVGRMTSLGGEWDAPRGAWLVPKANRADLDALLADIGVTAINIPEGMRPATDQDRKRLVVPPAWTDVFVGSPDGKYVVIGTDAKGRRQYRRSATFAAGQDAKKFAKIKALHDALPGVDERLQREHLTSDDAAAAMLIRRMGLRPGSTADTKADVQAYGATTLLRRHVHVSGDEVRLKFVGKDGVHLDLRVEDTLLRRMLTQRTKGKTGDERLFDTSPDKVNRWLDGAAPGFTAKDYRTYLGTSEAAAFIATLPEPQTPQEQKALRNKVGDHVAAILGNTRTVALKSYIDPSVFKDGDRTPARAPDAPRVRTFLKARDAVDAMRKQDVSGLSDDAKKGVALYGGEGNGTNYQLINNVLRVPDGEEFNAFPETIERWERMKPQVEALVSEMDNMRTPADVRTNRTIRFGQRILKGVGIDLDDPDQAVGKEFTEKGFSSTTMLGGNYVKDFFSSNTAGDVSFQIDVPAGSRALLLNNIPGYHDDLRIGPVRTSQTTIDELLLAPNTKFRIKKVEHHDLPVNDEVRARRSFRPQDHRDYTVTLEVVS